MLRPGEKSAAARGDNPTCVAAPHAPGGLPSAERLRRLAGGAGTCPAPAAAA
jgi:hypothetical protein